MAAVAVAAAAAAARPHHSVCPLDVSTVAPTLGAHPAWVAGEKRGPLATESAAALVPTGPGCAVVAADPSAAAGLLYLVGGVHSALARAESSPLPTPSVALIYVHLSAATIRGGGDAAAAVAAKRASRRVGPRPRRLLQQPPGHGDAGGGDSEPRRTASNVHLHVCGGRGGGLAGCRGRVDAAGYWTHDRTAIVRAGGACQPRRSGGRRPF